MRFVAAAALLLAGCTYSPDGVCGSRIIVSVGGELHAAWRVAGPMTVNIGVLDDGMRAIGLGLDVPLWSESTRLVAEFVAREGESYTCASGAVGLEISAQNGCVLSTGLWVNSTDDEMVRTGYGEVGMRF